MAGNDERSRTDPVPSSYRGVQARRPGAPATRAPVIAQPGAAARPAAPVKRRALPIPTAQAAGKLGGAAAQKVSGQGSGEKEGDKKDSSVARSALGGFAAGFLQGMSSKMLDRGATRSRAGVRTNGGKETVHEVEHRVMTQQAMAATNVSGPKVEAMLARINAGEAVPPGELIGVVDTQIVSTMAWMRVDQASMTANLPPAEMARVMADVAMNRNHLAELRQIRMDLVKEQAEERARENEQEAAEGEPETDEPQTQGEETTTSPDVAEVVPTVDGPPVVEPAQPPVDPAIAVESGGLPVADLAARLAKFPELRGVEVATGNAAKFPELAPEPEHKPDAAAQRENVSTDEGWGR